MTPAASPPTSAGIAPVAGRLVDRLGGRYLVMAGLALFLLNIAAIAEPAEAYAPRTAPGRG